MCGGALPEVLSPTTPAKSEIPVAELATSGLADSQQRLLIWLGVIVVAVVGFGVAAAKDWAIAILYVCAVVPTLLVVLFGTTLARAKGTPWSPGKTAAVVVTTAAGTVVTTVIVVVVALAVAVLVAFAMIIALFEQCLQMLGGGGS